MRTIYRLQDIRRFAKPVVAIGVFDGLHRGHSQILRAAVKEARRIKGTSIVVTFYPHPQGKESIYSLAHRLQLFEEIGVQACIVIKFNRSFSMISAESFVKDILVGRIAAYAVYVGENFRFGAEAGADVRALKRFSADYGFRVKVFKTVRYSRRAISSTGLRRMISRGHLRSAEKFLLRPVSVFGKVVQGSGLATKLGFPTANIYPHHEIVPPPGIYAVRVFLDHQQHKGVCYIGSRPTKIPGYPPVVNPAKNIEVHIFGFRKNIYGHYAEIQFVKKIRQEQVFATIEQLSARIKKDVISAKRALSSH
jgi:riboflavin kinase / FMN adenylyltransferase